MKIEFEKDDLRPLIREVVAEVLQQRSEAEASLNGKLAYSEAEAAALLSVRPHVLADCRRRGEISARRCGREYRYARDELLRYLESKK